MWGRQREQFCIALLCIVYSRNDMDEVVTKRIRDTKENNLSTC